MTTTHSLRTMFAAVVVLILSVTAGHAGSSVDSIRNSGKLDCGVVADVDDYSEADMHGDLSALGAAYRRAVAAGVG